MNIFVYSDESGVLDKAHNDIFVFGGLVFLSKDERDVAARKYSAAEKALRNSKNYKQDVELKAAIISAGEKRKLFRSLNRYYKFGVIVEQTRVLDRIMADKKSKQRYLDYVFKIGTAMPNAAEIEVEEWPVPKESYSLSLRLGNPLIPLY